MDIYGFLGLISLIVFRIRTKFVSSNARIIRFPFRIRGKILIRVGKGFTTGFNCRIDAYSENKNDVIIKISDKVQIYDYVHLGVLLKV